MNNNSILKYVILKHKEYKYNHFIQIQTKTYLGFRLQFKI